MPRRVGILNFGSVAIGPARQREQRTRVRHDRMRRSQRAPPSSQEQCPNAAVAVAGHVQVDATDLGQQPLTGHPVCALMPEPRPAGSCLSYPRCSVISSASARSSTAFDELGIGPSSSPTARARRRSRPGRPRRRNLADDGNRFRRRTRTVCREGRGALAVDDVQWLDSASAQTLAFALRRLPSKVGVLLAHRVEPGWELPLELARALPEDRLLRIVSRPLSLAALHHLVKSRLGTSLPPPLLARLANASGGNPFYALENGPRARARRRSEARAAFAHPRNLWNWWSSGSSPYRRPHGSPRSPRPPPHSRLCLSLCRRFPRMPTSARLFSRQRRRGVGQFARYGSGDTSETSFTLDNRQGPIWGSRGREFKSRQPDNESPSGSRVAGRGDIPSRPWIRHRFRNIFRTHSREQPRGHGQRTEHRSQTSSDRC